jgi:hypothetical protein
LKEAKVSDAIIRAMQSSAGSAPQPAAAPRPGQTSGPPNASAQVSSAAARPAPAPSLTLSDLQEPSVVGEPCRFSATGAPSPLEKVKVKDKRVGKQYSTGFLKPAMQDYIMYFEGVASPVSIRNGEPQAISLRVFAPGDRWGKDPTPEEVAKHVLLTRLRVEDGKRIITKADVPFDVKSYGKPATGLDPKKPDRLATSFVIIPRAGLPPGEYAVYVAGTHNGELVGNFLAGTDYWVFSVAPRQ